MKGDFSKDTFRKKKHFHDVHMQQGRVLLDSDWNEQADIYEHRIETGTLDIIGKTGAPYHDAGFDIIPVDNAGAPVLPSASGTNIKISAGRFYVDGIMCENDATVLFAAQPDYDNTPLPTEVKRYLFYLDVWQRHITALEDSDLREVALGGPDTTTRNKTVWQVKYNDIGATNNCVDELPASITNAPTGKLTAQSEKPTGTEDPCGLAVSGGYRRLENQLYRVEIHKGADNRAGTTFKWSRDNGSVIVKWESVEVSNTSNLVVSSIGRDELLGFKSGDWIEMIDDKTDLLGFRGPMVQLSKVDGNVLSINPATNIPGDVIVTAGAKNSRIRRWDSAGEIKPNTNNVDWIDLEDGVQVQFKEGSFRTGDYWLIPARTATADIEWPIGEVRSPNGVQHHYAKLGIADFVTGAAPGWVKISDYRSIFPPLNELITLNYVGGDGQEARPGEFLDEEIKVAVSNGQWRVKGARVIFTVESGGGSLEPGNLSTITLFTDDVGIARCKWKLGAAKTPLENQRVRVNLIDACDKILHLPVIFSAKLTPPCLFYVSGDGQEANLPGLDLPADLKVGVAYEQFPVTGAKVKFTIESGGGSILPANASTTGTITLADGLASCKWKLGTSGLQQVKATLFDAADKAIHIPIIFNASLIVASNVAFDGGDCNNWVAPKPINVAEALTALCKRGNKESCTVTVGREGQFPTLAAAFQALSKERDICICLLPSRKKADTALEHVAENIDIIDKDTIEISGCGATVILLGEKFRLSAKKIILKDIEFESTENTPLKITLQGREVSVYKCSFGSGAKQEAGKIIIVSILGFTMKLENGKEQKLAVLLDFYHNLMNPEYIIVALGSEVQGRMEDNEITGTVILQSEGEIDNILMLKSEEIAAALKSQLVDFFQNLSWDKPKKKELMDNIKQKPLNSRGSLRMRGNTFGNVFTNGEAILKLKPEIVYKSLFISENIFRKAKNSFAGKMVDFVNNQFPENVDATVAFVLGEQTAFTGNISSSAAGPISAVFNEEIGIVLKLNIVSFI